MYGLAKLQKNSIFSLFGLALPVIWSSAKWWHVFARVVSSLQLLRGRKSLKNMYRKLTSYQNYQLFRVLRNVSELLDFCECSKLWKTGILNERWLKNTNNLEFYIVKEHRRNGYAYETISAFIESCIAGDITGEPHNIFSAEVITENKPCIMLLEKLGFKKSCWGMNMSSDYDFYRYEYAA